MNKTALTCEYSLKGPAPIGFRGGTFPAILCGAPAKEIKRDGMLVVRCTEHKAQ